MKTFEVNGNLRKEEGYEVFRDTVVKVRNIFIDTFGIETMSKYDLYVDNALEKTGHTPSIIPILSKYLIIKLHIKDFYDEEKIAYQTAHELCHYVIFTIIGLDSSSDVVEENICSAMSLIVLKMLYPENIDSWIKHVNNLENNNYNKGVLMANCCKWNINVIKKAIYRVYETKKEE